MTSLVKDKDTPEFALVVTDIFRKLADVVPTFNRDGESAENARESFKRMGYNMSVYSDDDGAFANKNNVQKFFESEGTTHLKTKTHAHVAERFIRTLKTKFTIELGLTT